MEKIYLAAPYTSNDKYLVEYRVEQIMAKAAELIRTGYLVFSPITHSHEMAQKYELPLTFEYWQEVNHSFIDWSDTVFVYMMPGWRKSRGVSDEINYSIRIGKIPVLMDY